MSNARASCKAARRRALGVAALVVLATSACGARTPLGGPAPASDGGAAVDRASSSDRQVGIDHTLGADFGAADFVGRDDGVPADASFGVDLQPGADASALGCNGAPLPAIVPGPHLMSPALENATAILHPEGNRLVFLGGRSADGKLPTGVTFVELDSGDVFELDVVGDPSVQLTAGAAAFWDAKGQRAVVFGGTSGDGQPQAQVYSASFATPDAVVVTRLADYPAGPVTGLAAALDTARNVVVLTGGQGPSSPEAYEVTNEFDLAAEVWTTPIMLGASFLPPAAGAAMAFDPVSKTMLAVTAPAPSAVQVFRYDPANAQAGWVLVPGALTFVSSVTPGLYYDAPSCGFVMLSAVHTRCTLEMYVLRADSAVEVAFWQDLPVDDSHFAGTWLHDASGNRTFVVGGDSCSSPGNPAADFQIADIVR